MQSSGTLGYALQGVSQQPERVQPDGHVKEQINWIPDANSGLTSRPGSTLLYEYNPVDEDSFTATVTVGEDDYLVICKDQEVKLYTYTGVEVAVTADPGTLAYIGRNMVAYATDEEIVLVNKDRAVTRDSQTTNPDAITQWGYAYHLGGQFARTYRLSIRYADGTVAVGEYTTPDGSSSGDAEATTANAIITAIRTALLAHPNRKSSTSIVRSDELLSIQDSTTTFSLVASDGDANTVFRAGVSEAKTFADVPRLGIHNAYIRVRGEVGTNTDDVWLRFEREGGPGGGFGDPGVWVETADPTDRFAFNLSTMPHVLTVNVSIINIGAGPIKSYSANLTQGDWDERRIGNDDTNPIPSFVGLRINDVGEFSNRLWFLAGNNFITSRTNNRNDFFRASAVQIIDTDAIDIRSTGEDKTGLLFGIAYDRDLLLFSSTGQFSIAGGAAFTPGTASMVRSTNFEMSTQVRPEVAGATVLMPYRNQIYSGINELKPSLELDSNAVEDLSKVTKRYIRGEVQAIVASGNSGTALITTDDCTDTIYVYNFLWEDGRKIQSAFHKWIMPLCVTALYIKQGVFYVWFRSSTKTYLAELRPDRPEDFGINYNALLDIKRVVTLSSFETVLDRNDYAFIANVDNADYTSGITVLPEEVNDNGNGTWTYVFKDYVPIELIAGLPFVCETKYNKPVYTDWRGAKVPSARIVIGKYVADYVQSGGLEAEMISPYRGNNVVATNDQFPTDDDPLTDFGRALADGSFDIPWGDDNFSTELVIRTNTLQPATIVEVRWWGQLFRGKK